MRPTSGLRHFVTEPARVRLANRYYSWFNITHEQGIDLFYPGGYWLAFSRLDFRRDGAT